jgi:hypothetical protein
MYAQTRNENSVNSEFTEFTKKEPNRLNPQHHQMKRKERGQEKNLLLEHLTLHADLHSTGVRVAGSW